MARGSQHGAGERSSFVRCHVSCTVGPGWCKSPFSHLCAYSDRFQQEIGWGQSAARCPAVECLLEGPVLAAPSF